MIYNVFCGNMLIFTQEAKTNWLLVDVYSTIRFQDNITENLKIVEIASSLAFTQNATGHISVKNINITHTLLFTQRSHPRSFEGNVTHTIPFQHFNNNNAYGPIEQSLTFESIAFAVVPNPLIRSVLEFEQEISVSVIRTLNIASELLFNSNAISIIPSKTFLPNRGDFIPPNAQFIYDVNLKIFVLKPAILNYNQDTGYYEGTNSEALFVQSNGFALWPN